MGSPIFDITDRVAIVTGGSKGLGARFAMDLAGAGADVVITSRHLDEAEKVAERVRATGRKALALEADASKVEQCRAMIDKTVQEFGRLDILVNNAGVLNRSPLFEVTEEDYDYLFGINVKGLLFSSKFAAEQMAKQKKGRIINITAITALTATPNFTIYGAAKAAVAQMTRVAALEWGPYGITVNAIAPFSTPTEQNKEFLAIKSNRETLSQKTAMGRIGMPEDLSGALLLLASDASSFITGQSIYIDGGASIGWAAALKPETK
jgi:2-dehydro-3-deoxy-D-gluconate 5-dehydrogenase